MAKVIPFRAYRPAGGLEDQVAALPYDVYSRGEAKAYVSEHPRSFLAIDRAESLFPDDVDTYDPRVYAKARQMLDAAIADGTFVQDEKPCYYLYEQTWRGRTQTGIVGCSAIDDYLQGVIRKHENTVEAKEQDRVRHVDACSAQTGPIFLAYRGNERIAAVMETVKESAPVYDFVSDKEVRNRVWIVDADPDIEALRVAFAGVPCTYIADGHHRAASAVRVGLMRRAEHPDYDGTEEFNYFLSVLFPESELAILDYNRVVLDTAGLDKSEILARIRPNFHVTPYRDRTARPHAKGEIGMYMDGAWYLLSANNNVRSGDVVKGLDVSILQDHILTPLFGIRDPRTDSRIAFVGGIRGVEELTGRADAAGGIAFLMYPTSIRELLSVADAGRLMPPKSTWFEPKLLSGLFIHRI